MKFFVNLFITLFLFTLSQPAFCQKLPAYAEWYQGTINEYPAYKDYFEEYTSRLYDNLKIKENFPWYTTLGVDYYYTINKDGSISDFEIYSSFGEDIEYVNKYFHPITYYGLANYSKKYEEYVKKVIYENPPKPFPKEIEYDKMNVELQITVEPKNKKESDYQHKEFKKYYNIEKNNLDICAFDMNGGNSISYGPQMKTSKYIPPTWDIKIFKFR